MTTRVTCPYCHEVHRLKLAAGVMYAGGSQYPVWVAVCPVTGEIVVYNREAK